MSDLKEFWNKQIGKSIKNYKGHELTGNHAASLQNLIHKTHLENLKEELGLFFWERGGKQFVKEELQLHKDGYRDNSKDFLETITRIANTTIDNEYTTCLSARDFLDCIACLGEEKVKELIKELEGVEQKK